MCFFDQKGFLGLWGERVDSIDYYKQQIKDLDRKVSFCFCIINGSSIVVWKKLYFDLSLTY